MRSRKAGKLVSGGLGVGATGPVSRSVFPTVDTFHIATGYVAPDPDKVAGPEGTTSASVVGVVVRSGGISSDWVGSARL